MEGIRHIFFDLDHTLWDFERNAEEAITELLHQHALPHQLGVAPPDVYAVYTRINDELWDQYARKEISKEELRYQRFHKTFLHFGLNNEVLSRQIGEEYLKISPYKPHLMPHAKEVLAYLHGNYELHLLTNGFVEVQHIKMASSGLTPYFNEVIVSEEHGYSKPDTRIFELLMQRASADRHNSVMIGDNYEADIMGAHRAGLRSFFLDVYDQPIEQPVYTLKIQSLAELLKLL